MSEVEVSFHVDEGSNPIVEVKIGQEVLSFKGVRLYQILKCLELVAHVETAHEVLHCYFAVMVSVQT